MRSPLQSLAPQCPDCFDLLSCAWSDATPRVTMRREYGSWVTIIPKALLRRDPDRPYWARCRCGWSGQARFMERTRGEEPA